MKNLDEYLKETIDQKINSSKNTIKSLRKGLKSLEKTGVDNSNYIVGILSYWANEGEDSTIIKYEGNLKEAIKAAEKDFLRKNNRSDIQGEYHVGINIQGEIIDIPNKYWNRYKKRS